MEQHRAFLCLSSEGSGHIFPYNSPTCFANRFPKPIFNEQGRTFSIRLVSISLGGTLALGQQENYLNVHIYEMEAQRSGHQYTQSAGGFAYPPRRHALERKYGLHTFRHSPHLPLRYHKLEELHVRLTNKDGKQVELTPGYPTLLWIELTDAMKEDEFMITCSSEHPEFFPSNSLNIFSSPLPSELELKSYEVALLNIIFPAHVEEPTKVSLEVDEYSFHFQLRYIRNARHFVQLVKDDLNVYNRNKERNALTCGIVERGEKRGQFYIMRNENDTVQLGQESGIKIVPSPTFTRACGQVLLPRERTYLQPGEMILFEGKPNVNLALPNPLAMVHCDIINHNIVAGEQGNLLQWVPAMRGKEENDNRLYEPEHLAFHPVVERPFNKVGFAMLNPDGRAREFKKDNPASSIIITLIFRKNK